jgi:hypothetical protein
MHKFLKDPLLHFLVIGIGLFVLFEVVSGGEAGYDRKVIEVNNDTLLNFLQFRTRAFEPSMAAARMGALDDEQLENLIGEFVREEALHREALALGMDQNDYIIKQRLIQSIEFITAGFAQAGIKLSDEDVESYYLDNRENYAIEPFATFTHVFFSTELHGKEEAKAQALGKLDEMNEQQVPFHEAPGHGDRFLYATNYVEREPGFVASHFGPQMAEAVFELQPNEIVWQGPFESPYGFHVILLTRKDAGRIPELTEVVDIVRYDAERDAINAQKDKAIQGIVDTYEVRRNLIEFSEGSAE